MDALIALIPSLSNTSDNEIEDDDSINSEKVNNEDIIQNKGERNGGNIDNCYTEKILRNFNIVEKNKMKRLNQESDVKDENNYTTDDDNERSTYNLRRKRKRLLNTEIDCNSHDHNSDNLDVLAVNDMPHSSDSGIDRGTQIMLQTPVDLHDSSEGISVSSDESEKLHDNNNDNVDKDALDNSISNMISDAAIDVTGKTLLKFAGVYVNNIRMNDLKTKLTSTQQLREEKNLHPISIGRSKDCIEWLRSDDGMALWKNRPARMVHVKKKRSRKPNNQRYASKPTRRYASKPTRQYNTRSKLSLNKNKTAYKNKTLNKNNTSKKIDVKKRTTRPVRGKLVPCKTDESNKASDFYDSNESIKASDFHNSDESNETFDFRDSDCSNENLDVHDLDESNNSYGCHNPVGTDISGEDEESEETFSHLGAVTRKKNPKQKGLIDTIDIWNTRKGDERQFKETNYWELPLLGSSPIHERTQNTHTQYYASTPSIDANAEESYFNIKSDFNWNNKIAKNANKIAAEISDDSNDLSTENEEETVVMSSDGWSMSQTSTETHEMDSKQPCPIKDKLNSMNQDSILLEPSRYNPQIDKDDDPQPYSGIFKSLNLSTPTYELADDSLFDQTLFSVDDLNMCSRPTTPTSEVNMSLEECIAYSHELTPFVDDNAYNDDQSSEIDFDEIYLQEATKDENLVDYLQDFDDNYNGWYTPIWEVEDPIADLFRPLLDEPCVT
ncbi:14241_t:CDS:2 [Cetraspora pellucida]|uniref:14241_t:CDS:1 n=1 Tax=Cetraspora pellucida TaxID=1433469 RepID=A0A9N8W8A4_9GLOM|nr:14241_t:CDS:2 [Cetraspora pellucida]